MPHLIPVSNSTRQTFSVRLPTGQYRFRIKWLPGVRGWYLSIFSSGGNPIVTGIGMTANRRLLIGYRFREWGGGDLYVQGRGDLTRRSWGQTHNFYWLD